MSFETSKTVFFTQGANRKLSLLSSRCCPKTRFLAFFRYPPL